MAFDSLVSSLDTLVTSTFQRQISPTGDSDDPEPLPLTIKYSGAGADVTVIPVVKNPALELDFQPGTNPGPGELILFIGSQYRDIPIPRGSRGNYNGETYDIAIVGTDRVGGRTLKMRKTSSFGGE